MEEKNRDSHNRAKDPQTDNLSILNNITGDPQSDGVGDLNPEQRNELALSEFELDAGPGSRPVWAAYSNRGSQLPTIQITGQLRTTPEEDR